MYTASGRGSAGYTENEATLCNVLGGFDAETLRMVGDDMMACENIVVATYTVCTPSVRADDTSAHTFK